MSESLPSAEKDAATMLPLAEVRRISKAPCVCHPARRMLVWIGTRIYCSNCGPNACWDNGTKGGPDA